MFDILDRDAAEALSARGVLAAAAQARRVADRSEADLLVLAGQLADLSPGEEVGAHGHGRTAGRSARGGEPVLGGEQAVQLAGPGAPSVAEFAPEDLAVTLGISGDAARRLVGDALELRHRLPRLWALVLAGHLQPWRARQVTTATRDLPAPVAAFVDRHLAVAARRNRVPNLAALVHDALLQHAPEVAEAREQVALAARGVWTDHRESTATSRVTILADTHDALAFDATITDLAAALATYGDADPLDLRRARAVGVLADPQRTLDLVAATTPATLSGATALGADQMNAHGAVPAPVAGSASSSAHRVSWSPRVGETTLYLHLDATTSLVHAEQHGAMTLALLQRWLGRTDHVTVRPVLDLAENPERRVGTETRVPPTWVREAVVLRDPRCVFPGCTQRSRGCDLDHITPYRPPDAPPPEVSWSPQPPDAPEPQTRPENLAPLCRRHHRMKTHGHWSYTRNRDGTYTWSSPLLGPAPTITVDHHGARHPSPTHHG